MNAEVENLPNCVTTLKVEVPKEKVSDAFDRVTREFLLHAKIPGYRPGKAPRKVIESRFKKEIREEVQKSLLSESYRDAVKEKDLHVLQLSNIEDLELDAESGMRFTATVVTAPAFELPDYRNIPINEPSTEVTEAEVEEAIEGMRQRHADFQEITDRPLQMEDFAIIDYRGTIDGKPVDEAVPKAGKPLAQNDDFWLKLTPEAFFPGFADQIVGARPGDTRAFDLGVPADFPIVELQGLRIHYEVTVKGARTQVLPELNDAFAAEILPDATVEKLREMAREEITAQKKREADRDRKNQVMSALLTRVECELPQNLVKHETRRILSELVRENQARGIPDEALKENQKELIEVAGRSARDRLKGSFILMRIAEAEKIKLSREELMQRVALMAMRYRMTPEKMLKELKERDALDQVNEEILSGKVLDFLTSDANVQSTSPVTA